MSDYFDRVEQRIVRSVQEGASRPLWSEHVHGVQRRPAGDLVEGWPVVGVARGASLLGSHWPGGPGIWRSGP